MMTLVQPALAPAILILIFAVLLAISMVDARHLIIPDSLQVIGGLAVAGLICINPDGVVNKIFHVLAGTGSMLLLVIVTLAYKRIRKADALGWGDIKLMAWLSWLFGPMTFSLLLLACILAMVYLCILKLSGKAKKIKEPFAFGPFLASAAALILITFWVEQL